MRKTQSPNATQVSIAQGNERYSLLVQSIKEYAMFIVDTRGRVTDWNVGAEYLLGYTEEAILGKNYSVFLRWRIGS
jgi:PAS domain S-box-containing protein